MGRKPLIPVELTHGPFTLDDARRAGLRRWHIEGASWNRLGPGTYMWSGLAADCMHDLAAARRRLPDGAVFSGLTAAWLHGLDVTPGPPIEATVPVTARVSARSGIRLRRSSLAPADIVRVRDLPATSIAKTLAEICKRFTLIEAVVLVDAAIHARRMKLKDLDSWVKSHAGRHGVPSLRRVLDYAEPLAESPMESRLRMVLVMGGLPRPKAQVSIHDRWGRFVGRPDLYYEQARLGIEYDGGVHREMLAEDNRRQNRLLDAGVRLLRFTAGDVLHRPDTVVLQVRALLGPDRLPQMPARTRPRRVGIPFLPANAGLG
jgi:very-short-patch-repair endonuclease